METLRYAIIDDDMLAHNVILKLMQIHQSCNCVGRFYSVVEAIEPIRSLKPDFVFLDIDMPNFSGFELIKFLDKSIKVIVTTSHRKYALDGYDYGILDFLTKPVRDIRLLEAITKVSAAIAMEKSNVKNIQGQNTPKKAVNYLWASRIKEKEPLQIDTKEIYYITKLGNNIEIYTDNDGPFYKVESLKEVFEILPEGEFAFASQSYIFNLTKIKYEDNETISYYDRKEGKTKILIISPVYIENFTRKTL